MDRSGSIGSLRRVSSPTDRKLRIAAIRFLNPAPLMWDFEHPPLLEDLMNRYTIESMLPSECADRLVAGTADVGLVPIAALATAPQLHVLPGCTIASKGKVRSLLLVRRTNQELKQLRSVAADTASRTTIAYARILFRKWANPGLEFVPLAADLDAMLERADAAIVIGDPALLALEERANRFERTGEELVYHDLADEWRKLTGLPFVSAIWATSSSATPSNSLLDEGIANDLIRSRDHGLAHIEELAREWSRRIPVPEQTIRTYLSENIHYVLDEECIEGMRGFFREAAQAGILPQYEVDVT
ncbi:MAG TPA: menaquinone biosynthesis protein [Terracidiphilus sp.]|nr:menaquinone biosynthesis protein [Terracidiphilus sp.]